MFSPRRSAQCGLAAASLILVSSVFILVAGATDAASTAPAQSPQTPTVSVSPAEHAAMTSSAPEMMAAMRR